MATVRLCALSELRREGRVTRWVDELRDEVTAVDAESGILVFSSVCPHFGGEFDFSEAEAGTLRCRWHNWKFDAFDGRCLNYDVKTRMRHYEFKIEDEWIVLSENS
jgi:nitrite reductase/ring-hydroxylating ferredoxin subunit